MAKASVERAAVTGSVTLCKQSIQKFAQTAQSLSSKYQAAGAGWKDQKYKQLGDIVTDCNKALQNPVKELQDCITKLNELIKQIDEYENVSL